MSGVVQLTCHLCRYFRGLEGLDEANGMVDHGGGHGVCIVHVLKEMVKALACPRGDARMAFVVCPINV